MSNFLDDSVRRLVPRWRSSRITASLGELDAGTRSIPAHIPNRTSLDLLRREWERNRTSAFASDLVGAAFVDRLHPEVRDAATALLDDPALPEGARFMATRILELISSQEAVRPAEGPYNAPPLRGEVRRLRAAVRSYPGTALGWADLSLAYASLGLVEKALKAMEVALSLEPNNRFVVRSAARLWIHNDDPERAHIVLSRCEATRRDPWILAAEVASAQVAGRKPKNVKVGMSMLEGGRLHPRHTAELSGALATLELDAGKTKAARKLFAQSLVDPTENTIAQANWATRRGIVLEGIEGERLSQSWEALAMDARRSSRWGATLDATKKWLADEPFSSRPALHGSFIASIALDDPAAAIEFAEAGLLANPQDLALRNNLIFALASADRIEEAAAQLGQIPSRGGTGVELVCLTATRGLIAYRSGDPARGREEYEGAIEAARQLKQPMLQAQGLLHLALEELRVKATDAVGIAKVALKTSGTLLSPEIVALRRRLESRIEAFQFE